MAGIKELLEKAGYAVEGLDESSLIAKLDEAGYDVSGFKKPTGPNMEELIAEDKPVESLDLIDHTAEALKAGDQGIQSLGTLAGSQDLQEASDVAQGNSATSRGGKVGKFLASFVTPSALATEGALGAAGKVMLPRVGKAVFGPGERAVEREAAAAIAPLEEKLMSQTLAKQSIPERMLRTKTRLEGEKQVLGEGISEAEEAAGIAFKTTPDKMLKAAKNPKSVQQFAETLRQIKETPIAQLKVTHTPEKLQSLRKYAQTFEDIGPEVDRITKANIRGGASAAGEALGELKPAFGQALKAWSRVAKRLDRLPKEGQLQEKAMAQAITETRFAINKTKAFYRDAIKAGVKRDQLRKVLIYTGLGAAGLGGAKFFF